MFPVIMVPKESYCKRQRTFAQPTVKAIPLINAAFFETWTERTRCGDCVAMPGGSALSWSPGGGIKSSGGTGGGGGGADIALRRMMMMMEEGK